MATRGGSTRVICAALAGNALIAATKFRPEKIADIIARLIEEGFLSCKELLIKEKA